MGPLTFSVPRLTQDQRQLARDERQLATVQHQLSGAVHQIAQAGSVEAAQRAADSHQLLVDSGIALGIVAALALLAGWLVAGRMLRPIRTITRTAQRISSASLHERLALDGPPDELKELGDTLDDLFDRLEASFDAQRQFVANASHELRTPLARQRALIQVALADPAASSSSLRSAHERVLVSEQHLEQMIEALLALTRGQAGLERHEPIDLGALASQALVVREPELAERNLDVHATLGAAPMTGDHRLIERLIVNLIENAIRHNVPDGRIEITTGTREGRAFLTLANSGSAVPPEEVERLFKPFQRLGDARTRHTSGHGLGLSIVDAIATAHRAELGARARPHGGLTIDVAFPPVSAAGGRRRPPLPGRHARVSGPPHIDTGANPSTPGVAAARTVRCDAARTSTASNPRVADRRGHRRGRSRRCASGRLPARDLPAAGPLAWGAPGMPEPDGPRPRESSGDERGGGVRASVRPDVAGIRPTRVGSSMVVAGAQHVAHRAPAAGERGGRRRRAAVAQRLLDTRAVLVRKRARLEIDRRRGRSGARALRSLQVASVLRQSSRAGARLRRLLSARLEHHVVLAQVRAIEQPPRVDQERRVVCDRRVEVDQGQPTDARLGGHRAASAAVASRSGYRGCAEDDHASCRRARRHERAERWSARTACPSRARARRRRAGRHSAQWRGGGEARSSNPAIVWRPSRSSRTETPAVASVGEIGGTLSGRRSSALSVP